jgi:multiple sugar transport system substrate-binding protein
MSKRSLCVFLALMLFFALLLGCARGDISQEKSTQQVEEKEIDSGEGKEVKKDESTFNWRKYAGTELVMLGRPWTQDNFPWEEFEKKTGIKVNIEVLGINDLYQKLMIEFGALSSYYDMFVSQNEVVSMTFEPAGWYEYLDSYVEKPEIPGWDINDFIPATITNNMKNGNLLGLPVLTETPVVFYRTDIFKEKGIEIPKTLDEMAKIARELTVIDKNNDDNSFYGFVARGHTVLMSFATILHNFGATIVDPETYTVKFNSPEGLEAAKYYVSLLRDCAPKGIGASSHEGVRPIFQMGKAAMYLDSGAVYNFMAGEENPVHGKFSAFEVPAGPGGYKPFVTTWNINISPFSKKKDAAWLALQWATSYEAMKYSALNGNCVPLMSVWKDEEYTSTVGNEFINTFLASLDSAEIGRHRPLILRPAEIETVISDAISKAIEGADIEAEWKKAAEACQNLLDKQKSDLGK